jgi:hypothetical protein
MDGYEVITSDEKKVGQVCGTVGENILIEHGALRKTRHALPKAFAHADDGSRVVRVTVSKEILLDSPRIRDEEIDEHAVAAHYGLADSAADDAPTRGRDDVELGAEQDAQAAGVRTGEQERADTRREMEHPERELPESPALLGDRTKQAREG